jgi:hypothetical protein
VTKYNSPGLADSTGKPGDFLAPRMYSVQVFIPVLKMYVSTVGLHLSATAYCGNEKS